MKLPLITKPLPPVNFSGFADMLSPDEIARAEIGAARNKIISEVIAKYESKKGFRAKPVENFLGSLGGQTRFQALSNLEADARSYGWKPPIVAAIKAGITKMIPVMGVAS